MLKLLAIILLALVCDASVKFSPPVEVGEVHWGLSFHVQPDWRTPGPYAFQTLQNMMVSYDGGHTYVEEPQGPAVGSDLISENSHSKLGLINHDFGNVTSKPPEGDHWSIFKSPYASLWAFSNGLESGRNNTANIVFKGLPQPSGCGTFACPFRVQGTAVVELDDGSFLQVGIVWWQSSKKHAQATTLVAYRSTDGGYSWNFVSVVADAADYPFSEEGPNEMDMVINNGKIIAVIRVDGGDGLETHQYKNYMVTFSEDQGNTWSKMEEIPNAGCARPKLLLLNETGPLILSGGRMKTNGTQDNLMWIDWSSSGEGPWEKYAISYWHNLLAPEGTPKFPSDVNTTSSTRRTHCYTGLVPVSDVAFVVAYDLIVYKDDGSEKSYGYSMRVDVI